MTVFLATFNRTETLERTVASLRLQTHPYELVIIDNGSEDPAALELLDRLRRAPEVRRVYRLPRVASMQELTDHFNVAVADQFDRGAAGWFAVTDADVCFEGTDRDALGTYVWLAEGTGCAVGPHLRVDGGLPLGYPLRSRVVTTEVRLNYRASMLETDGVFYSAHGIDTTFHVFPAVRAFRRLGMDTLRVGHPYDAMHLDWYLDIFSPTAENKVYVDAGEGVGVGSWGRSWLADFWWRFQADREAAFAHLLASPKNPYDDLCINSFILSWCFQIGAGTEVDLEASRRWLRAAIPRRFEVFWEHEADWDAFVYDNDFSALGWDAVAAAA